MKRIKKRIKKNVFILLAFICLVITTSAFAVFQLDTPTIKIDGYGLYLDGNIVTSVILKCKVIRDGGAAVTAFRGDIREKGSTRWVNKGIQGARWYEPTIFNYQFYNLYGGREAEFRVAAINEVGEGKPADLGFLLPL